MSRLLQALRDLDAVLRVLQRSLANGRIGIAERSVLVFLILKEIGIDRSRQDAISVRKLLDVVDAVGRRRGKSHSTCRATVGQTPVSRCTCPASLNFSSVVVAAAG